MGFWERLPVLISRSTTEVKSIGDLRHRIEDDFPEVVHYNYIISLNNEIITSDTELKHGDEVALMPPFAGG